MTCQEAEELRLRRASGPLEQHDERKLEEHLASCAKCIAFDAEIDALEANLKETLRKVAVRGTADRLVLARARSWRPLAVAAALVLAVGAALFVAADTRAREGEVLAAGVRDLGGAEVSVAGRAVVVTTSPRVLRLEAGRVHCRVPRGGGPFEVRSAAGSVTVLGTEFTVELFEEGPQVKKSVGGGIALAVGVVSGVVLLRSIDGETTPVSAGQVGVATTNAGIHVENLADVRKNAEAARQLAETKAALARSEAREKALAARVAELESSSKPAPVATEKKPAPAVEKPAELATPAGEDETDRKVREAIGKVDWKEGVRAIVALARAEKSNTQQNLDPQTYVALSKLNVVAAEVARLRGLKNPWAAYGDPVVQEQFAPAWLDALGANLDDGQVEALRRSIREDARKPKDPALENATLVERRAKDLREEIEWEGDLQKLLRPDQYARYLETVGDDPWFGQRVSIRSHTTGTPEQLIERVLEDCTKTFELGDAARLAARAPVTRYVQDAVRLPKVDPNLDPARRRVAALERSAQLAELQVRLTKELAAEPALTPEERARVAQGSRALLEVGLSR